MIFGSAEWAHPDIEFETADGPATRQLDGARPGGRAAMREFLSAWQEWRVDADEYRALDDERVLVLQHYSARGKTSGAELGGVWAEGANLFTIRDGKVTRLVCYFDRERALTDVQCGSALGGSRDACSWREPAARGA